MAKVLEVTYTKSSEKRPYPEQVSFKIDMDESDDVQQVIRRARVTAQIAFGERPTGTRAQMQRSRMLTSAKELMDQAEDLMDRGF